MATPSILELVADLTPPEQDAVRVFVQYLRRSNRDERPPEPTVSPFVAAAEEFIREHPQLLAKLAQQQNPVFVLKQRNSVLYVDQ